MCSCRFSYLGVRIAIPLNVATAVSEEPPPSIWTDIACHSWYSLQGRDISYFHDLHHVCICFCHLVLISNLTYAEVWCSSPTNWVFEVGTWKLKSISESFCSESKGKDLSSCKGNNYSLCQWICNSMDSNTWKVYLMTKHGKH